MMARGMNGVKDMKHRYTTQAIVQVRTKEGRIEPKAPAGISIPKGWRLTDDGEGFEKEPRDATNG
jgi:hypothetical protein